MNNLPLAIYSARFGDLVREARTDLDDDEFRDWLVMVSVVISRAVADCIEADWNEGS